jgi:DNA-binding MarR family transcriptional regulator
MPKKNSKSLTERQRKLVKLVTENFRNPEGTKTMYELMLLAGFSEESARQQTNILSGIREQLQPIVQAAVDHRNEVMQEMGKKIGKAKYRDLTDAFDKLTKNIQLLSGGKTANDSLNITWDK